MRHSKGLVTATEALRRVFLPFLQPSRIASLSSSRKSTHSTLQCLHQPRPVLFQFQQRYSASTWGKSNTVVLRGSSSLENEQNSRDKRPNRPPRDQEIRAYRVVLVEDGKLSQPVSLLDALNAREKDERGRPTQYLQEVAPANQNEERPYPICKMFEKKHEREMETAKQKVKKETKKQEKQLEINWTIDDNDLGHRLGKMKDFLGKGYKVEIMFGVKRKGWRQRRQASEEDTKALVGKIKSTMEALDGAREWKPMSGKLGGQAVLYFEGKAKQ